MSCGLSSFKALHLLFRFMAVSETWWQLAMSVFFHKPHFGLLPDIRHPALRWHRAKLSILTEDGYLMHVNNECSNLLVSDACNGFLLVRRDPEENIEGCLGKVSYYVLFILSMEEVSLSHILGTTVQEINSPWLPHARFRPQDFTSLQSDHIWRQALG